MGVAAKLRACGRLGKQHAGSRGTGGPSIAIGARRRAAGSRGKRLGMNFQNLIETGAAQAHDVGRALGRPIPHVRRSCAEIDVLSPRLAKYSIA